MVVLGCFGGGFGLFVVVGIVEVLEVVGCCGTVSGTVGRMGGG